MPPKGLKGERRLCPYCSCEVAKGYLWLHKTQYCPMRPGRQEEIKAEAMGFAKPTSGLNVVPPNETMRPGVLATGASPQFNNFSNIIPIDLTEEYNNMVKVMKKKKDEETDEDFQCGGCKAVFHAKEEPKYCPECGVPF